MSIEHIIHAWRDEEYREGLENDLQANLPASPIGEVDLSETDLEQINGSLLSTWACATVTLATAVVCPSIVNGGSCQVDTSGCC